MRTQLVSHFLLLLCAAPSLFAGTVQTLEGLTYRGEVDFDRETGVRVVTSPHSTVMVPWTNLLSATFFPGTLNSADFSPLTTGWTARDIGDAGVPGWSGASNSLLAVRAGGIDLSEKADAFHFVHRATPGDGEVIARVRSIEAGTLQAQAGVMIRESARTAAPSVALLLNAGGELIFRVRTQAGGKTVQTRLGRVGVPRWVKLRKIKRNFRAYTSADGKAWNFEAEADAYMPTPLLMGVAVTSHSSLNVCHTTLEGVRLSASGLLGEYFGDEQYRGLKLARIDPRLRFAWGNGSPDPALAPEQFAVRWTGFLEPRHAEAYSFYCDAEGEARLWVDGQAVPPQRFKGGERDGHAALPLRKGRRYELKMEYRPGDGPASVRLGWSSRSQPKEIIPASALFTSVDLGAAAEAEAASSATNRAIAPRGVSFRDGSFLAAEVLSVDEAEIKFSYRGVVMAVPTHKVARVLFRPVRGHSAFQTFAGRPGVLLRNGDFFEGDIVSANRRSLTASSVLFGLRSFRWEKDGVDAVVLAGGYGSEAPFELHAADGSILRAESIRGEGAAVAVRAKDLGQLSLARSSVLEIKRRGQTAL